MCKKGKRFKWQNFNGYFIILLLGYIIALDGFIINPLMLMPLYLLYVVTVWNNPIPLEGKEVVHLLHSPNLFNVECSQYQSIMSDILGVVEYRVEYPIVKITLPEKNFLLDEKESRRLWMHKLTPYTEPLYLSEESEILSKVTADELRKNPIAVLQWCQSMLQNNLPFYIDDESYFFDIGDAEAWYSFLKRYNLGNTH